MKKSIRIVVLLLVAALYGCATSSVFTPYPSQADKIKQQVALGEFGAAQRALEKKSEGNDKILYLMERGRVAQIAGDYETSVKKFEAALTIFDEQEAEAKITAGGAAGKAGAVLLNENAIPYRGQLYERIFVHTFQALNFLQQNDLEAAGVEARRANLEQQLALSRNEDEVIAAERQEREGAQILSQNRNYKQKFSSLTSLSSQVKNSIQNAYSFYLSGLVYELNGAPNDAYIDYKKALEIFPDNRYLRDDVIRLAAQLEMEELARYTREEAQPLSRPARGQGKLVVLYEQGYVPEKREVNVLIDLRGVPNNMVFPTYFHPSRLSRPLVVSLAGQRLGETEAIVLPSAMAARALEEQLPGMIVRQGLRVIARERMHDDRMNSAFGALASIGQLLLNRADLRSWLTLPAEVQILHTGAGVGEQTLTLRDGINHSEVVVDLRPGRTTVVHVIAAGGRLHARAVTI